MRLLLGTVLFSLAATAAAQPPRVIIDNVAIGFPAGRQPGGNTPPALTKAGAWAPVYVDLTAGPAGIRADEARLIVRTTDNEDIANNYTVPVPPVNGNEAVMVLTYVRPGNSHEDIRVRVVDKNGGDMGQAREQTPLKMEPNQVLILQVGATLPGLRQALAPGPNQESKVILGAAERDGLPSDRWVEMLPEHWFGYESVDLLLFTTSNRDFLTAWLDDKDPRMQRRREALAEWVRRGGKMAISVGRNQDVIAQFPALAALLPVTLHGTREIAGLKDVSVPNANKPLLRGLDQPVEIVQMQDRPGHDVRNLAWAGNREHRLGVQAGAGLGQVSVISFDWNQAPFTAWPDMNDFWKAILTQNAAYRNPAQPTNQDSGYYGQTTKGAAILNQLQVELENFKEVPVISFGWVALFIALYILIVGPLEYLLLKKFGRLELTWITFPSIVLVISAVAYFTAYWLKGEDLRINKIDVVEVDLAGKRAYGTTWFTVFSPRIQHYTVGIEPAPGWVPPAAADPRTASVVLSWLGAQDVDPYRRSRRGRGPSLFSRAYDYEPAAVGLRGVPIQVWSTKSFAASWQTPLDGAAPLIAAELRAVKDPPPFTVPLTGHLVSNLPAPLEDAVLLYTDKGQTEVAKLGTLQPGAKVEVGKTLERPPDWKTIPGNVSANFRNRGYGYGNSGPAPAAVSVKMLLFANLLRWDRPDESTMTGGTGPFDQSWRLLPNDQGQPTQVILYGRLAPAKGIAEQVTTGPASATRLWLGNLPGAGQTRPTLSGDLRQETFVRVFIPLATDDGR